MTREQLREIQEKRTHHDPKVITDLKKRKLLKMQKVISFRISKGPKYALEMVKEETDLTAEMLASGSWKTATFSEYCVPTGAWPRCRFPRSPSPRDARTCKRSYFCRAV